METTTVNNKNIAKTFKVEDKEYIILEPSLNILREAKFRYSKSYTDAVKGGLYTRKKLETLLREEQSDVINDHISRRSELLKNLTDTQDLLNASTSPDQTLYLAELVRVCRESLLQEDMSMNNLFASTAEQLADEDRINYLTFSLVKLGDGKDLWNTFEEFMNDNRFNLIDTCKYNIYCWDFKVDPQWRNSLPEEIAIKKVELLKYQEQEEEKQKELQVKEPIIKKTIKRKTRVKKIKK
jgi:hypothetical protein